MGRLSDFESTVFKGTIYDFNNRFLNFVETGCYKGGGLRVAENHCRFLLSCDISKKYVDICEKEYPNACIFHMDSIEFLNTKLPLLFGKTLFWLDAHYPKQYDPNISEDESNKFPLLEELKIIKLKKEGYEQDVILCDDLRVVQSTDNPVLGKVGRDNLKNHHLIKDKIMQDYLSILSDTHNHQFIGLDSLLFTPKEQGDA